MNIFLLSFSFLFSTFLTVDQPDFLLFHFSSPYLNLHPLLLSISKGQMFPAVTVALHWHSALNLAKSQGALSASSNHTAN